ncbi:MAG: hypothetical protein ABR510_01570 [Trueperaceae bacterium]
MSDVPYYLETRMRQTLVRAHELARRKGLTHAFDAELFGADRAVHDLLGAPKVGDAAREAGAGTPEGARAAQGVLANLDDLLGRLQAARDRGPQGGDAPVGRAGRRPPGRR